MRAALLLVLLGGTLTAAPVPKALKAKPATADGVWVLVELNNDGRDTPIPDHMRYCQVDGEQVLSGRNLSAETGCPDGDLGVFSLRGRDPDRPALRTLVIDSGWTYPAVLDLDGDTLRWAFSTDRERAITECKPGMEVSYYVFQRVKGDK